MKYFPLFIIIFLLSGITTYAQQFEEKQIIDIPTEFRGKNIHWLDMDHDGRFDLIVQATDQLDYHFFLLYKNEGTEFSFVRHVETLMKNVVTTFSDVNMDGQPDIILSGDSDTDSFTTALISSGDFNFSFLTNPMLPIAGSIIRLIDLNQNGKKELIISGTNSNGPFFSIFELQQNSWVLVHDSLKLHATNIESFDFNRDGANDLFVTGNLEDASPYHAILITDRQMNFTEGTVVNGVSDVTAWLADVNYDGVFDVVMAGQSNNNEGVLLKLMSTTTGEFTLEEIISLDFIPHQVFVADLDSDGRVDIQMSGTDQASTSVNKIFLANTLVELLPGNNVLVQRFGDVDYDGDLDLVQLTEQTIHIYENTIMAVNNPPSVPTTPIAAILYGRLFMYWDKSGDDLTPQPSVTYDITLQTQNNDVVSGDFDLLNKRRLQVTHGNIGTHNHILLNGAVNTDYAFHVQAVDNAYHADENTCSGIIRPAESCMEIEEEVVTLCKTESRILTADTTALWFSFDKGFLGEGLTYEYATDATDTVFFLIPYQEVCPLIRLFLMERKDTVVREFNNTLFTCENSQLVFETTGTWAQLEWSSYNKGFLSNEPSITYTATSADTVKLFVSDGEGCSEIHRTAITISKPVIGLNGESFHILKGEEVQLIASGGNHYNWTPATGLNNASIPNPIASPAVTTNYIVTVSDSISCTASRNVTVVVQPMAFIPNLFTPNQDGTNDQLKIYGLGQVKNFTFSIMNREGSIVYTTTDITEATQRGWDGSVNGVIQPGGVYYWKVNGQLPNGNKLLLNGKDSGSIVLIR